MATKRCIPTRFFHDPDIIDLSKESQLILIGLVLHADDEGREVAHSKVLAQAMNYPAEQIEAALEELVAHDLIVLYQVGRHRYYSLTQQWQQMGAKMTPSKYPAPPVSSSEELPSVSVGNLASSGVSIGNPAQDNVIELNTSEEEEERTQHEPESLPENVTPFPQPRSDASDDAMKPAEKVTQTTAQVARILKLAQSEALTRLVTEYIATPGLSLLGEADAAREWIDDSRRNRRRQRMTPAFFRRWLKREQAAQAEHEKRTQATGTDGAAHSPGTPVPAAPPGPSSRSLMDLETQYRAQRIRGEE